MAFKRPNRQELYLLPEAQRAHAESSKIVSRVLRNIRLLLKEHKSTYYRMLRDYERETGIIINRSTFSRLLCGKYTSCHVVVLVMLANYWGLPLEVFMSDTFDAKEVYPLSSRYRGLK